MKPTEIAVLLALAAMGDIPEINMELRHLKYVVAVAENLNFSPVEPRKIPQG